MESNTLDELEQIFDNVFTLKSDYVKSARYDCFRLRSIPINPENETQMIRLYKKITWLMVWPKNYNDGLWATF
jgi:hypothetical protein